VLLKRLDNDFGGLELFKPGLDAIEREHPTFDRIVKLAKELARGESYVEIRVWRDGNTVIAFGALHSAGVQNVSSPATNTPGKSALKALEAEAARRKPKEAEVSEQTIDGKGACEENIKYRLVSEWYTDRNFC